MAEKRKAQQSLIFEFFSSKKVGTLIPSNISNISEAENPVEARKSYFGDDLPHPGDVEQEMRLWRRKWSS